MSQAFVDLMRELDEVERLPMEERVSRAYASLPEDDPLWVDIFDIGHALAGEEASGNIIGEDISGFCLPALL